MNRKMNGPLGVIKVSEVVFCNLNMKAEIVIFRSKKRLIWSILGQRDQYRLPKVETNSLCYTSVALFGPSVLSNFSKFLSVCADVLYE